MDDLSRAKEDVDVFAEDYIQNIQIQADVWWPQFAKYIQKSQQSLNPEAAAQAYLVWMMTLDWVGGKHYLPGSLSSYVLPEIAEKLGYKPEYFLRWQFAAEDFFKYQFLAIRGPRLFDLYLDIYRYPDQPFVAKKEKRLVYDLVDSIGSKIKNSTILEHFQ